MDNLTGEYINQKYQILSPLSTGRMSIIYQARELQQKKTVAVKFLKEGSISTYFEDLFRFKKEISLVSKLTHPHIVKTYEAGEYLRRPYLVMELLQGATLAELLRIGKEFSQAETIVIIRQLAEALCFIHRHSVIHRDIKPGNIFMVNPSGEINLKLLDFGVALMMEFNAVKETEAIAGTFGYMSPEATGIFNRRLDERSDLYSLGVVFYRLLSGRTPFPETDLNRLLYQQVAIVPLPLTQIRPDISPVLAAMVMKLLMKDPDMRYQSASGLLADLDSYQHGAPDFIIGQKDPKIKLSYQTRLLGREVELAKLKRLSGEAREGKGCLCLISGEAGIGKSRLVEELRSFVYEQKGLFIKGRCLNYTNKTPYQPFRDASDEYLNKLLKTGPENIAGAATRLQSFLGDLGEVIVRLNPHFSGLLNSPQCLPLLDEPGHEIQRFLMVAADFFCHLTAPGAFGVIFLDDLQWADTGSLDLLEEILRRIAGSRLMIVGTYRNNEIQPGHGLERIKKAASENALPLEEILLLPFQLGEINTFVAELLGEKEIQVYALADYLMAKSDGNPLFAINLMRELVENHFILWENGSWRADWQKIKGTPMASTILDLFLRRITSLDPGHADLLCKAAVVGKEFSLELLYTLTDSDKTAVINDIDKSINMQLLEFSTDKGKILFSHDWIRDALYYHLTPPARKEIHLQIANAIATQYRSREDEVLFDLAHHYFAGDDTGNLLKFIIPAADKAKNSYAYEEAIKYYQIGTALLEQHGQKGNDTWIQAKLDLMNILLSLGKSEEATGICMVLTSLVKNPLIKARIFEKMGVAEYYMKQDGLASCEVSIARGLKLLQVKLPLSRREVTLTLAKQLVIHLGHNLFARLQAKPGNKPYRETASVIVWIYSTLIGVYVINDARKFVCTLLTMLNISETWIGKSRELGISICGYAATCMTIPWFKRALKYQHQALELRTELRDEWGIAQSLQLLGVTYSWQGNHRQGIHYFTVSRDKFLQIGEVWQGGMSFMLLGIEYYYISDYLAALDIFKQALSVLQRIKNYELGPMGIQVLIANCYTETGAFNNTEEMLTQLFEPSKRYPLVHFNVLLFLGYLELEKSNFDQAIQWLEQARSIMRQNSFFKEYTTLLEVRLAEAWLKKGLAGSVVAASFPGAENLKNKLNLKKICSLCLGALKQSKSWPNRYGMALRVMAGYWALVKRRRNAEIFYLKGIHRLKSAGLRYELGKCYHEYGNYLATFQKSALATQMWQSAAQIFEEIGAQARLHQCYHLLKSGPDSQAHSKPAEPVGKNRFQNERRLNTVFTTSHFLSSILDPDELLEKTIDSVMELTGAERGVLLLYPESGAAKLELKAIRNLSPGAFQSHDFDISHSIITKIEIEKKPIIITDAMLDEELKTESSIVLYGIRSVICAPVMTKGKFLGVIYLDNRLVSGLFDEDDLQILDMVAGQAGVSIENARLYRRSQDYARRLEQSQAEIAGWNQALQERVQERTQELYAKNTELEDMNEKLMALNLQLQKYSTTVADLAIAEERNRLAHDLHDSLGQLMALSISQLGACGDLCLKSPLEAKDKLEKLVTLLREGLSEIRRSITGLIPEKLKTDNLVEALQNLIMDYQNSGLTVDFSVEGKVRVLEPRLLDAVYRACQEALTNSIKHGHAKEVMILLRFLDEALKIYISDDGSGCKTITKGLGLTGMEQRIKSLQGELILGSDGESGFNLRIEIPLAPNNI
ncbi:MAG TPA: protein kinase [Bacillota bacterium]|nr:protein kinase [Bacillota bacterium]